MLRTAVPSTFHLNFTRSSRRTCEGFKPPPQNPLHLPSVPGPFWRLDSTSGDPTKPGQRFHNVLRVERCLFPGAKPPHTLPTKLFGVV